MQARSEQELEIDKDLRQFMSGMFVLKATRAMIKAPHQGVYDSTLALMASNEWLILMLIPPGLVTAILKFDTFGDNQLFYRLGYDDPCVLFDSAPANILAGMGYTICAYFGLLHVHFKLGRLAISKEAALLELSCFTRAFIYAANLSFVLGIMSFPICLIIPPTQDVYWHTYGFQVMMVTRYLAHLSSFIEYRSRVSAADGRHLPPVERSQIAFMVVFGLTTVALPCMALYEYGAYEARCGKQGSPEEIPHDTCGHEPFMGGWIAMCVDYLYFICMFTSPYFLPHNPVFVAGATKLMPRDDANALELEVLGAAPIQHEADVEKPRAS